MFALSTWRLGQYYYFGAGLRHSGVPVGDVSFVMGAHAKMNAVLGDSRRGCGEMRRCLQSSLFQPLIL